MLAGGAEEIVTSIDCGGGVPPPPPLLPPPQALSKAKLRMKRGADFLIILSLREILECSSGLATRYTSAAQKWAQCSRFVTDLLPRPPRASLLTTTATTATPVRILLVAMSGERVACALIGLTAALLREPPLETPKEA